VGASGNIPSSSSSLATSHCPLATRRSRRAFTLVELLITVSIIAIMASMVLFAVYSAQEMAKTQKTKALIAKLDAIIKAKYETYKTARVQGVPLDEFIDRNGDGILTVGDFVDANWNGVPDPGEFTDVNMNGVTDPG
jgi:prepilin-type N-terminal cleavage/methylation domain-containing protein